MTEFSAPGPLDTPVLFLVFNRPEPTKRVFEAIRRARPPRLYIGADGARTNREGEAERVDQVRRIATAIDWPCEVKTLFRDRNLGCRDAVSSAITWFFENEEAGIILEDDCLPSQSFFWFCEAILERYCDDNRIWQVSGYNAVLKSYSPFTSSYIYSSYGSIWGWATWRSRWMSFSADLADADADGLVDFVLNSLAPDEYSLRRRNQMNRVISGQQNTWDYQWFFARLANSGLSVVSAQSLVANIGFGMDATHTSGTPSIQQPDVQEVEFPLIAPPCIARDRKRDIDLLNANFSHIKRSGLRRLIKAIKKRVL